MKLLIVDDDERQLERYGDSIGQFEKTQGVQIEARYECNLEDGLKALAAEYDGAIVDLKLSSRTDAAEGNRIIREIRANKRFPICVLTGYPNDLESDFYEELQQGPNLFFWLEKRDRPFAEVLSRLTAIYRSGVLRIVGPQGIIEEALNRIFWTHLAKVLAFWSQQEESVPNRKSRLLRLILAYLLQRLETDSAGQLDDYYADEMYIVPPLRDTLQTGDIVIRRTDEAHFLVLTPACDLAQQKAKSVQLVEIDDLKTGVIASQVGEYRKAVEASTKASGEDKEMHESTTREIFETLERLTGNSYSNRYHFLAPCQSFRGGMINFQKLASVPFRDFQTAYSRCGTVSPTFLKDIVARFASYYARQGQPTLESAKIVDGLIKT